MPDQYLPWNQCSDGSAHVFKTQRGGVSCTVCGRTTALYESNCQVGSTVAQTPSQVWVSACICRGFPGMGAEVFSYLGGS